MKCNVNDFFNSFHYQYFIFRTASFGLVTFLLAEKLERKTIRKYLFVFSVAAPLAALATYFGLSQKSKETLSTVNATGFAMLFS